MSVINQVLNQLEQRGAHTAAEQTMVRAVPHTRRNFIMALLAFGLALMIGIAAWQWVQTRKPVMSSVEGPNVAAASIAPKAPQGFSHPEGVGNSPSSYELEKLTLQHQPVEIVAPVSGFSAANLPASQLSFELSSVPLPSTLRSFDQVQDRPFDPSTGLRTGFAQDKHRSGQATSTRPLVLSTVEGSGQALTDEKSISENPDVSVKTAKSQSIKTAASNAKVAVQTSKGALPMKHVSPAQQADAEFRKAAALMQQGRIADALAGYEAALRLDAGHDAARQALVALLLEGKRGTDAERVLQERLNSKPDHTGFTMMLARLQVERGAVAEATATLEKALPYANSQADYQAFLAALLQRQNRNDEAIAHYQIVLQLAPNNGIWLMGYGISLQAMQRNADAKDAFKHALDTQTLSPDLRAFVQQKLKGL
jgi:MSHA biogenesis protein MshN